MRNDLLDALAAVDWAEAQIPIMQERFVAWQRCDPYEIVVEPDPDDADRELLVAYPNMPLDPLLHGDAGAIINSARTALDLLMSALLTGHSIKPNDKAHFPIKKTPAEFLATITMFENKKWISPIEAAAIKRTKAYIGGDHVLYPIHQLDILRKHERLITVTPFISRGHITERGGGIEPRWHQSDDKTILFQFQKGRFNPTKSNTNIGAEIFFNEPPLGVANKPAILALRAFTTRIKVFIESFP